MTYDDLDRRYYSDRHTTPTGVVAQAIQEDLIKAVERDGRYSPKVHAICGAIELFASSYGVPFDADLVLPAVARLAHPENWFSSWSSSG